jgi:aspartyl/glutamyl-tRNA(Asn/Gln) amidotransferase C subunit
MISKEDIEGLAQLARLELTEAEKATLQKDVSNILDYVGQVSTVGITDAAELKPILRNIMREDKSYSEKGTMILGKREMLVEAFPKKEPAPTGGFFNVVRKIIQKDE